jgi:hypothetical protein
MEKRFESELAKRISTGRGRASPFGVKFLAMAISVVAVFSIGAAAVLGVIATKPANAGPVDYVDVESGTDYLIYDLTDADADTDLVEAVADDILVEEVFAVKREMTLKAGVWDAPAPPVKQWTKVVYTVNVRLRDLAITDVDTGISASVDPVDLIVGQLDIMYNGAVLSWVSESFTINGCELVKTVYVDGVPVVVKADAVTMDLTGQFWTIQLPDLTGFVSSGTGMDAAYNEGDSISVSLMLKAPYIAGSELVGFETGFETILRDILAVPAPSV